MRAAYVHQRLPRGHRHPAVHSPHAGPRHGRRTERDPREQPVSVRVRQGVPAGKPMRGAVHLAQEDGARGHWSPRALRRGPRSDTHRRARCQECRVGPRRHRGLGPVRPRVRGRPCPPRHRGGGVRSAARGRWRSAVRDPELPVAQRIDPKRNPRPGAARCPLRGEQGRRQDVHVGAAIGRDGIFRPVHRYRCGLPDVLGSPGRIRRASAERQRISRPGSI